MVDNPELTADGDQGELNVQAIDDVPAPEDHGEQAAVRTCLPRLFRVFCSFSCLEQRWSTVSATAICSAAGLAPCKEEWILELASAVCLCQTPPQGQSRWTCSVSTPKACFCKLIELCTGPCIQQQAAAAMIQGRIGMVLERNMICCQKRQQKRPKKSKRPKCIAPEESEKASSM